MNKLTYCGASGYKLIKCEHRADFTVVQKRKVWIIDLTISGDSRIEERIGENYKISRSENQI